ncbi:hypothetical protein, partial [Proteus terrae]|uniref:hypothetical protein n=1 Tax=Proteus terrae TaxID=1574161 RepID=UPI001CBBD8AA
NYRIVSIHPNGTMYTIAGTGTSSSPETTDGKLALNCRIGRMNDLTGDQAGTLFFAELYDHRIRAIYPNGTVYTIAGRNPPGR